MRHRYRSLGRPYPLARSRTKYDGARIKRSRRVEGPYFRPYTNIKRASLVDCLQRSERRRTLIKSPRSARRLIGGFLFPALRPRRAPLRTIRRRPFGRFRLLFTYTICPAFDFSPLSVDFSLLCQSLTIPLLIFLSQLFLKKSKFPFFYLYLYYYYYYYNNNKDINSKTERAAVTVPYHSRAGRSVPNSPVLTE